MAGRAHDLHPTGTETAVAGLCVRSAVRGGDSGGGQPGPGQFHRHRPGAVCGTFPQGGGSGAGSGGVGGAHGGHPPGVPAQPATGAGDGGDLHRRRGRGDCRQCPEAPPGDGADCQLCLCPQGGGGGLLHRPCPALRIGPGGVQQRGGGGHVRHGPRLCPGGPPGKTGHVGHL